MRGVAVEAERFENFVRAVKYRAAGSLVYTAGLHSDEPVFDYVGKTYTVGAAQGVEFLHDSHGRELLAVDGYGFALHEGYRDVGGFVRRRERTYAHFEESGFIVLRLVGGIFEIESFVRKMPQVLVLAVIGLAVDLERDIVSFGVVDLLLTALDVPYTPGSDYLHLGRESLDRELETHLVVALTGATVANGVRAFLKRYLHYPFSYDRTGKRGAQEIVSLVFCARLEGGEYVILDEFLFEVRYVQFARSRFNGFLLETVELRALSDVARYRYYLGIVVILFEPGDYYRSIQSARIREYYFLYLFVSHDMCLRLFMHRLYPTRMYIANE